MRRVIAGLLVVLVLVTGALGVRAYEDWQMLQRPPLARLQDTSRIRGWMTVRFIANSHRVPVQALAQRLDAPNGNVTLNQLAQARGMPPPEEESEARQAVAELRAGGGP
jgi:hypothetical protein